MRRLILLTLLLSAPLLAQDRTTGAIAGRVEDDGGNAVRDARVEITSPALITRSRTAVTDEQGRFRFAELPPGRYRLIATAPHLRGVRVDLPLAVGETAEVRVRMIVVAGEEAIEVHAAPPLIDTSSSSKQTIFTRDDLRRIPNDRELSHLLDLAPGINLQSAYGGAEESGNAYEIDGVDVSDPQGGAPWSPFNTSLIDEVQLIGLGAPAEFGQFTGVVFNTITKSGGNEQTGSTELYYTGQALMGNSVLEDTNASLDSYLESIIESGGPLRRDRLWYYVSGQYLHINSNEGGPTQREINNRVFLKLTGQPRANTLLQGWLQADRTRITGRDGTDFTPLEATTGENNPEKVGNLLLNSVLTPSSILHVAWSGYSGSHRFDPRNGLDLSGHFDAQTGFFSVNAAQFALLERSRNQLNASLSHHSTLLTGFHDFKVGLEAEHSRVRDRYGVPGGAFYSDNEGPVIDRSTGKPDLYTLASIGGGYDAHGQNQRASFYAQDSWRITPRLTLNPGVRVDRNQGRVTGATVFRTNAVAPRLGAAWDLRGDGTSLLRAHVGRYYEALYSAFYYYMDPGAFAPLVTKRTFNTSRFTETLTSTPGQQYAMDPHIKQPYLDQAVLGFDQQLPFAGIVAGVTLINRKNSNFIETVSRDGIFVPVTGEVPGTGQRVTLYDYLNPNTDVLLYTNPRGLHRSYRALMLTADRPFRNNWQLGGSYVFSRTRGNIDNLGFDETGLGGNTPFFDGHFLDTPNSLVNAEGRLTHDQTHQVKLRGTKLFRRPAIALSGFWTYHSGDTWTARSNCLLTKNADGTTSCHDFPQGPVVYLAEARGSRRLKARNELDLRAEWTRRLLGRRLRVDFDMFNIFSQTRATSVETLLGPTFGEAATANFARSLRLGFALEW